LRFWESKFPQVRPLKRGGGRRYYRPEDVDLLRQIRGLLYEQGYTIKGAQKLLRSRRTKVGPTDEGSTLASTLVEPRPQSPTRARQPGVSGASRARLVRLRDELARLRDLLQGALDDC
jgi:DNA-binding transcriptional MerR regulator